MSWCRDSPSFSSLSCELLLLHALEVSADDHRDRHFESIWRRATRSRVSQSARGQSAENEHLISSAQTLFCVHGFHHALPCAFDRGCSHRSKEEIAGPVELFVARCANPRWRVTKSCDTYELRTVRLVLLRAIRGRFAQTVRMNWPTSLSLDNFSR